jgi:hypothetical protein
MEFKKGHDYKPKGSFSNVYGIHAIYNQGLIWNIIEVHEDEELRDLVIELLNNSEYKKEENSNG